MNKKICASCCYLVGIDCAVFRDRRSPYMSADKCEGFKQKYEDMELADVDSNPSKIHCRLSWDEYFMEMAILASKRSTCIRRAVGAVIVKDNQVISTGYNGVPSGIEHCSADSCIRLVENIPSGQMHEKCRGLHAEQNAIIQAANGGRSLKGATLYCTTEPCIICAKMIINSGISEIVYLESYDDELSIKMIGESLVKKRKL